MKRIFLASSLLVTACGGTDLPQAESKSVLTAERPHDGSWALSGQKPIVLREGYENETFSLEELQLADNGQQAIQRDADEGDQPVFVADDGSLYLRTDRRIDLAVLREGHSFWPDGTALSAGEARDDVEKDIYGSDDRTWWSDTTSYPARAHVALRSSPDATTAFCTGSAIGPRHVLTAGHCLYRDGAFTKDRASLRVVFGQNGSGNEVDNTPHGKRAVVAWVLPNGWINEESRRYDYALLILEDEPYSPGWLGFTAYSFTTLMGLNVNVNGYPGHSYSCAASPRADGLCGGYLYHTYGALLVVTSDELLSQLDWEHGNSGGPLYRLTGGNRYVVGIVSASNPVYAIAARMRSGMSDALCSWIGSYPSSHFSHNCQ
jgi:V8-like Glu-specific endopeptidase